MLHTPADTPSNLPPPAETRAERRMRRLEQMADLGVTIGRRLERQSELASAYAESAVVPDNLPHSRRLDEIARSFAQVCRAVAVATALEDRIDQGLPALPELDRARRLREQALGDKRAAVRAGVARDLDTDPAVNPKRLAGLTLNLDRLLDQEALDLDLFLDRPLPQLVERLRRQLGLDPIEGEAELWADTPTPAHPRASEDPGFFVRPRSEANQRAAPIRGRDPLSDQTRTDADDGKTPGSSLARGSAELVAKSAAAGPPPFATPQPAKHRRGRFVRRFPPTRGP